MCVTTVQNEDTLIKKMFCYDWSSDALLKSDTSEISQAFSRYFFFLNHNDQMSNPYPNTLELKAKIMEPIDITGRRSSSQKLVESLVSEDYFVKIANSHQLTKLSTVNSLEAVGESSRNIELVVERSKEQLFFFRESNGTEVAIKRHKDGYNFGSMFIDCGALSCTAYRQC